MNEAALGGSHDEKVAVFNHLGFVGCSYIVISLFSNDWTYGHSAQTHDFYLARQGARFRGLDF
jgi:hypothetical protein